MIGTSVSHSSN